MKSLYPFLLSLYVLTDIPKASAISLSVFRAKI
nr:MAG TPA: hypothetical protein [Caudoviricetes sp.]